MAIECGFFNSMQGTQDRKYSAEQMAYMIDALVKDGVMQNYGQFFGVTPGDGLSVNVGTGMAWFNSTWTRNTAAIKLTLDPADVSLQRIDAIVLEVNKETLVRENTIKVIKGVVGAPASKPNLIKSETVNQYPLAYVTLKPNATTITSADIDNMVGKSECPWILGVLTTVDVDLLFEQWDGEFNTWFNNIKAVLDQNVVTKLQSEIEQLESKVEEKADKSELGMVKDIKTEECFQIITDGTYKLEPNPSILQTSLNNNLPYFTPFTSSSSRYVTLYGVEWFSSGEYRYRLRNNALGTSVSRTYTQWVTSYKSSLEITLERYKCDATQKASPEVVGSYTPDDTFASYPGNANTTENVYAYAFILGSPVSYEGPEKYILIGYYFPKSTYSDMCVPHTYRRSVMIFKLSDFSLVCDIAAHSNTYLISGPYNGYNTTDGYSGGHYGPLSSYSINNSGGGTTAILKDYIIGLYRDYSGSVAQLQFWKNKISDTKITSNTPTYVQNSTNLLTYAMAYYIGILENTVYIYCVGSSNNKGFFYSIDFSNDSYSSKQIDIDDFDTYSMYLFTDFKNRTTYYAVKSGNILAIKYPELTYTRFSLPGSITRYYLCTRNEKHYFYSFSSTDHIFYVDIIDGQQLTKETISAKYTNSIIPIGSRSMHGQDFYNNSAITYVYASYINCGVRNYDNAPDYCFLPGVPVIINFSTNSIIVLSIVDSQDMEQLQGDPYLTYPTGVISTAVLGPDNKAKKRVSLSNVYPVAVSATFTKVERSS